jgi:signal transduction histidine kinase
MDTGKEHDAMLTAKSPSMADRLRTGSLVLAGVILLNGVLDVLHRPGGIQPVAWIYVADLVLVLVMQAATRHPPSMVHVRPLAAIAVMLWNALFCSYALASPNEIHALVAPSIVITTAAALLLPWGVRWQALVAVVCVLTYGATFAVVGRAPDLGTMYALVSLLGAALGSIAGAYVIEQHERIIESQTQRLQDQNRLMREAGVKKDEFLAAVSHELRTPLNVVLGYIDLLLDHSFGPLEPAQRDVLHRITRNASNLSHLINDLIDLSRIEAGRLKVELETVDVAPLVADMSGVMDVLLAGHDVAFSADVDPACTQVVADPDRLKQIVSNLLVNAVKFTERGSITLRVEARPAETIAISVADTGIGIPEAAHRAIFEPFRQVHDRSRRIPGAGIGLSISARLAHLMSGNLTVESEPGRGSRFTLTVPAAPGVLPVVEPLRHAS